MDLEQMQEYIQKLENRIKRLEVQRITQQQMAPNSVSQSAIIGGDLIFRGLASARPSNGNQGQRAYFATDTKVLSIWTGSAWATVSLT